MGGNIAVSVHLLVAAEIDRAKRLHGPMTPNLERSFLILAEEFGEYAKAVADFTRVHRGHAGKQLQRYDDQTMNYRNAQKELVQVIATALQILENFDRVEIPE